MFVFWIGSNMENKKLDMFSSDSYIISHHINCLTSLKIQSNAYYLISKLNCLHTITLLNLLSKFPIQTEIFNKYIKFRYLTVGLVHCKPKRDFRVEIDRIKEKKKKRRGEWSNLNLSEGLNRRLNANDTAFEGSEMLGMNANASSCNYISKLHYYILQKWLIKQDTSVYLSSSVIPKVPSVKMVFH